MFKVFVAISNIEILIGKWVMMENCIIAFICIHDYL